MELRRIGATTTDEEAAGRPESRLFFDERERGTKTGYRDGGAESSLARHFFYYLWIKGESMI